MSNLSKSIFQQIRDKATEALPALVGKIVDKLVEALHGLVDKAAEGIKLSLSSLGDRVKTSLQPETQVAPQETSTEPKINTAEIMPAANTLPREVSEPLTPPANRLLISRPGQLPSNPTPLLLFEAPAHKLVDKLAAHQVKPEAGFIQSGVVYQLPETTFTVLPLVAAAA